MIQVTVREQDARQMPEADPCLQDLALCPFAAIDQKTIFVVRYDLSRKPALRGRSGGGGAEKENFEQR
jgi:hypothetical protein